MEVNYSFEGYKWHLQKVLWVLMIVGVVQVGCVKYAWGIVSAGVDVDIGVYKYGFLGIYSIFLGLYVYVMYKVYRTYKDIEGVRKYKLEFLINQEGITFYSPLCVHREKVRKEEIKLIIGSVLGDYTKVMVYRKGKYKKCKKYVFYLQVDGVELNRFLKELGYVVSVARVNRHVCE